MASRRSRSRPELTRPRSLYYRQYSREIGGLTISDPPTQAEVQALRDRCEELADDVRALSALVHALRTALVASGLIKGSA
jgi:hypothetical protein